ncbi:hypothetical protein SO802_023472 [Lithocarpus litseifolius]|uniref:Uncharacterized protein n=1 Tax=Lithocarpus litseifolius TaxID=425828 RepID=A0AAW2CA79_9ROSI
MGLTPTKSNAKRSKDELMPMLQPQQQQQQQNAANQTANSTSTSAGTDGDDDDDEPIQDLWEPFSKDQIINLLCEAADKHHDVADQIRKVADEDPAHRKIFVHGLSWDTIAEPLTAEFKEWVF